MEDKLIFNTDIEDVPKVEVPKVQKKPVKQVKQSKNNCPECGEPLEHEGGCVICKTCGFSKCD